MAAVTTFLVYLFADITDTVRGDILKWDAADREEYREVATAAEAVAIVEAARSGALTGVRMDFSGDDGVYETGVAVRTVIIQHALNGSPMGLPEVQNVG